MGCRLISNQGYSVHEIRHNRGGRFRAEIGPHRIRMRNGCASSKAILQKALGAACCTTVMNASHINSSASETLYRVSRNLNVLKRGIDAIKIIGRLVVVRFRFAADGNRGVSVRISAPARPVLVVL
jgi:hypothetical protein